MLQSHEQKKTYKWLEGHGFSYYDINHLIKLYKEEGIKFNIKSFNINDFDDLRAYLKEQHHNNLIDYLLQDIVEVDKDKVKKMLYNR